MDIWMRGGTINEKKRTRVQTTLSTEKVLNSAVSVLRAQVETGDFAIGTFIDIEGTFQNTIEAAVRRFEISRIVKN